jgi:hypothetical protein
MAKLQFIPELGTDWTAEEDVMPIFNMTGAAATLIIF